MAITTQRFFPARLYYGWVIIGALLTINITACLMNGAVFSFFVGPMSEDLGVGKSAISWGFTFRLLAAGLTGPFLGPIIDRHGARWPAAVCATIAFAALLLLSQAHALWLVYIAFILTGVAGFGSPSGQLTQVPLARWFVHGRAKMFAIVTTGLGAGTVVAIPVTQWLIDSHGWRSTTMLFAFIVAAVIIPVSIAFLRRAPEDLGTVAPLARPGAEARQLRHSTSHDWTAREALRTPTLWLILSGLCIGGMVLNSTVVHRVAFWQGTGMSTSLVSFGTAIDPLVVIFSSFAVGMAAEHIAPRYVGFAGLSLMGLSLLPMAFTSGQTWTIFAHSICWGVGAGGYITVNNLIWPSYFGTRSLGAIRGIAMPVTIAGSGLGPPLYGFLFDRSVDATLIWSFSAVGIITGGTLILLARPPHRREPVAAV